MVSVGRGIRQKVIGGAAVAVLVGGGALAAVSATGQSSGHKPPGARHAARAGSRELAAAASYLGLSYTQLASELRTGKSLAQIADATAGKSAQGLIETLEAARKARLAAAAGRVSRRVGVEVNRPGGPALIARARGAALFSGRRHLGQTAAAYLGSTAAQLKSELLGGRTLAQLAQSAPGKSEAGLIDALLAAEQRRPSSARLATKLTAAQRARRAARLRRHATRLVERHFAR
jgi:hypothetical protein